MHKRSQRAAVASGLSGALLLSLFGPLSSASATHVLDDNESDIGVYTDGESDSTDIGSPTYKNTEEVADLLDHGVPYTANNMNDAILAADKENGAEDYYLDRVLGVKGAKNNNVLQTRGRSLYMRGASGDNFSTLGFAGDAHAGGPNNLGDFYTIDIADQTVEEVDSERFNAPSHATSVYDVGDTGVTATQKKFITHDNVAVTTLSFENTGGETVTLDLTANSPLATGAAEEEGELVGTRELTSGSNNGLNDTAWSEIEVRLAAQDFEQDGSDLTREVQIEAGESTEVSVTGVLYGQGMPDSLEKFRDYAAMAPSEAFETATEVFNEAWADEVPYINVPDPAVEKAILYRWWGERYNTLDVNEPGYVYQYPSTQEGVNLYQNSIVLTQPMHLQDTKWLRTPYLPYGQIMNVGELSGSSAFLDSPGHTSWNNHYSQYLGTAGLEAFNVHGGGESLAERFGYYFEWDGVGQLEHYDGNDNDLIAYDTNYMPGNDADAISFGYPKVNTDEPGSRTIERPESAYVWGAFDAAAELYDMAGVNGEKVDEMNDQADAIKDAILENTWSEEMQMFLARTSYGAEAAAESDGGENPLSDDESHFIPAKETNMYNAFAQNIVPHEDWEDYVDAFRFMRYGDNFPIFPFYTANQYDRDKFGIGGSNNFSNINFTVQYRAIRSALRHYDPEGQYVTPEYANQLLDWMAWSIYPDGDVRVPNQAEYYSDWDEEDQTFQRNNPNHVMLGNMNYIYIEDMGGIQPRSDDLIELWPIDFDYDHFMINNLRYHGSDVTIVWDPDGEEYGLGAGYSLFIDGDRVAASDELGRFVYDPEANEIVESDDGIGAQAVSDSGRDFSAAVDVAIEDDAVVSYLKTAGIDMEESEQNLALNAEVSASSTQEGERPAPWREFHTPGVSTSGMNYTPGATSELERPVSVDAINDGVTVNEPYWGNYGTDEDKSWVELDFGEPTEIDNVKLFFVSDRQEGGYKEPSRYTIQTQGEDGEWQPINEQAKLPKIPNPKFNEVLFESVTTDKVRVSMTNAKDHYTALSQVQVFNSGRDVPEVVNDPPEVTVSVDDSTSSSLSANVKATAVDDGLPVDGELTYGWETVSTPEDGSLIFGDDEALETSITGTVEGDYEIKFWASDGELTTERELSVTLEEKDGVAEFGASADIETSGSAGHEDPNKVNDSSDPKSSSPGAGNGWGTWGIENNGSSEDNAAWIQYSWDSPVYLASTEIYWYDDGGGTRMPDAESWVVEYSDDGEEWEEVELTDGSSYEDAMEKDEYNALDFEPVNAQYLRVRITGIADDQDGTGLLRWRAYGDAIDEVSTPVLIRTKTGEIPELPETLDVTFASGSHGDVEFDWEEITEDMVEETNVDPFVIHGTNLTYGLQAEARVYVRPELSEGGISIQGAEEFEETVVVGEEPYLPKTVEVSYNDGSKDNQAVGVDWDYDPEVIETPGTYEIDGELDLPWYVSDSGTTGTSLTLTVIEDDDGDDPQIDASLEVDTRCVAGNVILTARVHNGSEMDVDATITSDHGETSIADIAPDRKGSHAFSTREPGIDAGDVEAVVEAEIDGETVTEELSESYETRECQ